MTITTGPVEIETQDARPADPLFRRIANELAAPPVDRVAELKRELADELSKRIQQVETDLAYVEAEIDTMTERRKELAAQLRATNAELARIVGEPRTTSSSSSAAGAKSFPCTHPGCDRVFETPQGRGRHAATVHGTTRKTTVTPAPSPKPATASSSAGRTVFRCGELPPDEEPCGKEFRNAADLSHHTLTAHRRQPTAAEKILVTPDR